ncbi:hypothetical protein HDV05_008487, partial [Chytridiales sp. JEL 0842]
MTGGNISTTAARRGSSSKLCIFFLKGNCRYGDQCRFSHQAFESELEPCFEFLRKGHCRFGDQCRFSHDLTAIVGGGEESNSVSPSLHTTAEATEQASSSVNSVNSGSSAPTSSSTRRRAKKRASRRSARLSAAAELADLVDLADLVQESVDFDEFVSEFSLDIAQLLLSQATQPAETARAAHAAQPVAQSAPQTQQADLSDESHVQSLEDVLELLESYPHQKIITWTGFRATPHSPVIHKTVGNFDIKDRKYMSMTKKRVLELWGPYFKIDDPSCMFSIVLRQFCDDEPVHRPTGLPMKNIHSWRLAGGVFTKLPPEENKLAQCLDPMSGRMLPAEPA